jgi:hypothetical protein
MAGYKTNLSYCVWNVNGLAPKANNKLEDEHFQNRIKSFDIVGLVETHIDKSVTLAFDGFSIFQKSRVKMPKAKRCFGGIAVLIKNSIKHGVIHLPSKNENYHWIKLKKSFFSLQNDTFVCIAHIPPHNSTYTIRTGDTVLDDISRDILTYSKLRSIVLSGDLNARTGIKEDFILNDDNSHVHLQQDYEPDHSMLTRGNQDITISPRGNALLELCTEGRLRILNGRTLGDCIGKYTCHNSLGSSVVDYCIVSESVYKDVLYFKVHDFDATLSDHCQLSFVIKANINRHLDNTSSITMEAMPIQFHWSTEAESRYRQALSSEKLVEKVSMLERIMSDKKHTVENVAGLF